MTGRQWNDNCLPAPAKHFPSPDDCIDCVVAAFRENVGLESENQLQRSVVSEKHDRIHAFERREHIRSISFTTNWTRGPLQPANRVVTVYANDQRITARARFGEDVNVSGMKEIEHTVSEYNAAAEVLPPSAGFLPRHDFF